MKKDKKLLIIEVSTKLFNKLGYQKVSVDMIVEKANIAKWTFYLYFKSKSELYKYIVDSSIVKWIEIMHALNKFVPRINERMFQFMIGSMFFYEENPIIRHLTLWNKLYYSDLIDDDYLEKEYQNIISQLLKNVDFKKEFWDKVNKKDLWDMFLFYSYTNIYRCWFKTNEDFFNFAVKYAQVIVDWIYEKEKINLNNFDFTEIKKAFIK